MGHGLLADSAGNIIVVASETRSDSFLVADEWYQGAGANTPTNVNFFLSKLTAEGQHLWTLQGIGPGLDFSTHGNGSALDAAGNIYFTGQFQGSVSFGGQSLQSVGNRDMLLSCISPEGTVQWIRQYGNSTARGVAASVDADGVYSASLFFSDSIVLPDTTYHCSPPSGQSDVVIMKHDHMGNYLWSKHLSGVNSQQVSAMNVHDGQLFVYGAFQNELILNSETVSGSESLRYYLLSLNSDNGSLDWILVSEGGGMAANIESLAVDGADLYLSGRFDTPNLSFGNHTTLNSGQTDFFILKASLTGDLEWLISSNGSGFEGVYDMTVVGERIVVIGTMAYGSFSVGLDTMSTSDYDMFVAAYDNRNGNPLCGYSISGNGHETGMAIALSEDRIVLQGVFSEDMELGGQSHTPIGSLDMLIWKTCLPCDTLTSIAETANSKSTLHIHPNPASQSIRLQVSGHSSQPKGITITDMLGKTVMNLQPGALNLEVDISPLPTGIYTVSAQLMDGQVLRQRLVVHR